MNEYWAVGFDKLNQRDHALLRRYCRSALGRHSGRELFTIEFIGHNLPKVYVN